MAEKDKQTSEYLSSTEDEAHDSSERETSAKDTESENTSSPLSSDPTMEEILSTPTDESPSVAKELSFFPRLGSQVAPSTSGKEASSSQSPGFGKQGISSKPGSSKSSPSAKTRPIDLLNVVTSSTDENREILCQKVLFRLSQLEFRKNRSRQSTLPAVSQQANGREAATGSASFTSQDASGFGSPRMQMDEEMSSQSSSKSDESSSVPDNPFLPEVPEDGTVEQLDEMMSRFLIQNCPRSSEDALAAVNPAGSQDLPSTSSQTAETPKQRKTRAFRSLVTTLCRGKQPQMNQMAELCSRYSSSSSDGATRRIQDIEMVSDEEAGAARKPRARTASQRSKEQTPKRQMGADGGPSSDDSPKKKQTTEENNPVADAEADKKDSGEADDETDSPHPMETEKFFDYVVEDEDEEDKMC